MGENVMIKKGKWFLCGVQFPTYPVGRNTVITILINQRKVGNLL